MPRLTLNLNVLDECVTSLLKEARLVSLFYVPDAILSNDDNVKELVRTHTQLLNAPTLNIMSRGRRHVSHEPLQHYTITQLKQFFLLRCPYCEC